MSRLVAVSNRLSAPRRGAAAGGLVVGLAAVLQPRGGLWFGWNVEIAECTTHPAEVTRRGATTYAAVELSRKEYEEYYLGFSNGILWPLFHYFLERESYQKTNQRFARELGRLLESDDVIWVHDYHLIPLAQHLREGGATQSMGLFLHIPFPNIEVLRVLPVHAELLQAMLCYDLLGFQSENDLRAFHSAVLELWGPQALQPDGTIQADQRCVVAEVFPISVDVEAIQREAVEAQSTDACRRMVAGMIGRKLMIGVDRLDYSKGLMERFRAYGRFLETHPENENRVTFLQIAPLSRTDVRAHSAIRRELEQATGRINGRFAATDWTPIRYLNRNFPHDVLMSFLRAAQIGIVTPLRDGMNLVAKEFVAAQDPNDPGVLILSSLAGAAREFKSAVLVNPYDTRGIAHAIQLAFTMPLGERRERHHALLEVLRRNGIHAWYRGFLDRLATLPRAPAQASAQAQAPMERRAWRN